MADQKISQLPTITGANMADNDKFVLVDTSGDATVATTREEFFKSVPNVTFGDNDKAIFGAGSDLQIYHDGSNSYVTDAGHGNLILRGNANVQIEGANGENCAIFNENSSVRLFYDNVEKLETTSSGIDVTGTVTADGLTVETTTPVIDVLANVNEDASLRLRENGTGVVGAEFTYDGGDNQLYLKVGNNTNTKRLSVARDTGDISFYEDTGTTAKFFWDSSAESLGIGLPNPSSQLHLSKAGGTLIKLGTSQNTSEIEAREVSGANSLVLSSNNSSDHLVIVDGGNVGIGTSSPNTKLEIASSTMGDNFIRLNGNANSGTNYGVTLAKIQANWIGDDNWASINFEDERSSGTGTHKSGISFTTRDGNNAGSERMRINSSGNVGIGTSSPSYPLDVEDNTGGYIKASFVSTGTTHSSITFDNTGSSANSVRVGSNNNDFYVRTSGSERMRIDSSGNVLVGKTTTVISTVGIALGADGRVTATRDSDNVAVFNRLTNDGDVVRIQKDGTPVGSIGSVSTDSDSVSDLYIGGDNTGIRLGLGADVSAVVPCLQTTGALRNGVTNLGASDARFKDLYLSEGLRADTLKFSTLAGSELMRIDSSGNVGIGETNPTEKLEVDGTVKATSFEGDGSNLTGVGGSTTAGAVGTYTQGRPANYTTYTTGATVAGSSLVVASGSAWYYSNGWQGVTSGGSNNAAYSVGTTRSGTWRLMSYAGGNGVSFGVTGLWVRIS